MENDFTDVYIDIDVSTTIIEFWYNNSANQLALFFHLQIKFYNSQKIIYSYT